MSRHGPCCCFRFDDILDSMVLLLNRCYVPVAEMFFDCWHRGRFLRKQNICQKESGEKLQNGIQVPHLGPTVNQWEMQKAVLFHGTYAFYYQLFVLSPVLLPCWKVIQSGCQGKIYVAQNVQHFFLFLFCRVEAGSLRHLSAKYCPLVPPPRSTIAAAFSPDGRSIASTQWVVINVYWCSFFISLFLLISICCLL